MNTVNIHYTYTPEISGVLPDFTDDRITRKIYSDACFNIKCSDNGNLKFTSLFSPAYVEYNTKVHLHIPDGYHVKVYPRSSIRNYMLSLANSVGVIDQDYTGNIIISYRITGCKLSFLLTHLIRRLFHTKTPFKYGYKYNDNIAQLELCKNSEAKFLTVTPAEYKNMTEYKYKIRGKAGHGSTGT